LECAAQDGTVINVWLNFDEISPIKTVEETEMARTNAWLGYDAAEAIKEEKKEETDEEGSSHSKAA